MSYSSRARGDLGTGIDVAVDRVGFKKRRLLTVAGKGVHWVTGERPRMKDVKIPRTKCLSHLV